MPSSSATSAKLDKRYFHFVVIEAEAPVGVTRLRRAFGPALGHSSGFDASSDAWSMVHFKVRSERPHARGTVLESISERSGSRPPYLYDVVAFEIQARKRNLVAFGFPFIGFAREMSDRVLGRGPTSQFGTAARVDVERWLNRFQSSEGRPDRPLTLSVVGLDITILDDTALAAVKLGGEDPLSARLYQDYLLGTKKRAGGKQVSFLHSSCVLACESIWRGRGESPENRILRGRLHVGAKGDFKFYVQANYSNLPLLPEALLRLERDGCLEDAESNPLFRVEEEQD
jgi:hypothetical protein